jgi:hypothetical protein
VADEAVSNTAHRKKYKKSPCKKHFSVKIADLGSELISNFKGAIKNLKFDFFIYKETKIYKNYQLMYKKYQFVIISLQKNVHHVTQSL